MNANKPVDLDQLADQLARQDGGGTAPPDSTLKELKQELDTLAVQVAQPAPENEFEGESALERGLEFVKEIGRELSAGGTVNVVSNQTPAEDLGSIREYKLLAKLGEGGMGAVYKALHTKLNKAVALKILPADRLQNESAVSRFEREMRAVGKLEHPNIVRATDAGEFDGKHYLVMELVNGIDLSNLVKRVGPACSRSRQTLDVPTENQTLASSATSHRALTIPDACEMIRQAAIGLQEAHEDGMVHRDIKPSNLMLARSRKGRKPPLVKILDMGLALLDDHRGERRDLTSTGQMMGTLDYMAPEQGMDSHEVDIRADIYSLGATLHKLLTGQAPFPSDKYDNAVKMMVALATQQAPSIATVRDDLPPELAAIVDRMLARNPDERFAEPEEVAEALLPFCEGCDLAGLLESATAEDAESAEDESKVATHDSLKSSSVETAPTIEAPVGSSGSPLPLGEGQGEGLVVSPGHHPGDSIESTLDVNPAISPSPHRPLSRSPRLLLFRSPRLLLIAAALGGFVLLSAIIFYIKTNHGTIVVEIDDPSISVTVQGEDIRITKNDSGEAYQIKPGEHTLHVQHGDLEFDTDKFKLSRGEEVVLSVRLVEGEVKVVQKDEEQTVIGSRPLPPTPKPSTPSTTPKSDANYALAFDGKSTYVEIPGLKYDGSHPITIEAFVNAADRNQSHVIKGYGEHEVALHLVGEAWRFGQSSGSKGRSVRAGTTCQAGRRTHIAGVWDKNQARLFIDGIEVGEGQAIEQRETSPATFFLGASKRGNLRDFFHGIIDEVRISNIARYDKDFTPAERFEPDEHTLALYHFDEGQGEIARDSSLNKHDGKIVGAKWVKADSLEQGRTKPSTPSTNPTSASSHALAFDGKSNYVEMASLKFDTSKANTLEAWVSTSGTQEPVIIHGCEPGFPSLAIGAGGYWKASCSIDGTSWRNQFGSEVANLNTRTHVAAVWTGTKAVLFVDGAREKAKEPGRYTPGSWPESKPFEIGAMRDESGSNRRYFFHGIIDEVRISNVARYDKDFTPSERLEPDGHTLGLYHFDEGQGEIARDSSGNGHHGKIVGAKWVNDYLRNDPDGKIALWVLNSGGKIEVDAEGENKRVTSLDELPKGPFGFLKIDLAGVSFPVIDSYLDAFGFQRLEQLRELNLNGSEVTDASLVHLRDMKNLRVLNLADCPVGDYGLRYLPKSLTGLTLTGTEITDFAARWLSGLTQLEYLDVKGTQLSAEFVAKLKLVLPNCGIASDYPRRDIDKLVEKLRAAKTEREDLFAIKPVPIPEIQPSEPLASWALVKSPAKLEGVRSWTIETRAARSYHGRQILFSSDGAVLASGDWAVKLWRSRDRHLENAIVNPTPFDGTDWPNKGQYTPPPFYIRWSPDNSKLAIGASVWDIAQRRRTGLFVAPGQDQTQIHGADWSPDGKLLATCDEQGWLIIWDFAGGQTVDKYSVVGESFTMVRWSHDGKYLAAADSSDPRSPVIIWEFESGDRIDVPDLPSHWFEWSPIANEIAVEDAYTLRLFDLATRETLWTTERSGDSPIPAWSPDGAYLLARPGNILDVRNGRVIRDLETTSSPGFYSWSPDGKSIAIGEKNGDLDFFRGTSKIPFDTIPGVLNESGYVVRWSRDGTRVAPGGVNVSHLLASRIPVWSHDRTTAACKHPRASGRFVLTSNDAVDPRSVVLEGFHVSWALSPDGRYLVGCGQKPTALVGDVKQGKIVHELDHEGEVKFVAWSPVGNIIATVSYSSPTWLVSLWDSKTAERKSEFKVSGARAIAFSPDGKQLAVDTGSSTELWDVETLKLVAKFQQAASVATPLAWLDESTMAIACADGVLRVFNTTDSTLVREIEDVATSEAMFSSDGHQYVWSIGGSAVRVVDVEHGEPLGTMLYLRDEQWLAVSHGHFKGSEGISDKLIYIVQTDDGVQHTLTPSQFTEQYGWQNDPEKVWLAE